jgi:hypothetical protein
MPSLADEVHLKDGRVVTGKIMHIGRVNADTQLEVWVLASGGDPDDLTAYRTYSIGSIQRIEIEASSLEKIMTPGACRTSAEQIRNVNDNWFGMLQALIAGTRDCEGSLSRCGNAAISSIPADTSPGVNVANTQRMAGTRREEGVMSADTQKFVGRWTGTRTGNDPVTGLPFTINFEFEFRSDGTYWQRAGYGRLAILELEGRFVARTGRKPGDPTITHVLGLTPTNIIKRPSADDLRHLQVADLPNVEATQQWVFFYNLAPAGAMTLQDTREGSETWGLRRER